MAVAVVCCGFESPEAAAHPESLATSQREKAVGTGVDSDPLEESWLGRFMDRVRDRNTSDERLLALYGVSPVVGGIQTGAGTTAGLVVEPLRQGSPLYLAASGRASLRGYWGVESLLGLEADPFVAYGYGRYRHMPQEDFYGTGANTPASRHANYRLDDLLVGVLGGIETRRDFFVGGHVSFLENRLGPGTDPDLPHVDALFSPDEAPGMYPGVSYIMAGAWAEYDTRNLPPLRAYGSRFAPGERRLQGLSLDARRGTNASVEIRHYLDLDGGDYGFSRLIVEAQQYLPLFGARHVVALRQYGSFSRPAPGEVVPFYMMQPLGGIRSLRGFATFRFRDLNVMLANAEYRIHLWHFLQFAAFADVGHVARRLASVSIDDMEASHGAGLRLQLGGRTLIRLDVTRSREGIATYLNLGSFL